MADPRHTQIFRWLGLPPGNWPPDLYTLLGLSHGETNPRKIEQAAERRIATLRPYQVKYADLATEAMNAVASALVSLTSKVGQQSAPATPTVAAAPPAPVAPPPVAPPPVMRPPAAPPPPTAPPPRPMARPAGAPPPGRPPVRPPSAPLPPILTGTLVSAGPPVPEATPTAPPAQPPPAPPGVPVGTSGFPPAPLPRPPQRAQPAPVPPPVSAPPGAKPPPVPQTATVTVPAPVTPTPTAPSAGAPLRVEIVSPLPLPVDVQGGLGGGQGSTIHSTGSNVQGWPAWQSGSRPGQGTARPGVILPGAALPGGGRPAMTMPGPFRSPMTGLTGGAGGMPAPGTMWGPFNNSLGQATRNLTGLGKTSEDSGKILGKAGQALAVFGGPIGDRIRSMFSGTIGGAMAGYQLAGAPGAVAGAAAGFARDTIQLGGAANPQAGETWRQTGELAKTRVGGALGADIMLDQISADMQKTLALINRDSWIRGQMEKRGGAITRAALPIALPGLGSLLTAGMLPEVMAGKDLAKPSTPDMKALPTIPGVGAGMGSAMSYEAFSQALGMSTMDKSVIELTTMREQLENLTKSHGFKLDEIAEAIRNVGTIRPAFR